MLHGVEEREDVLIKPTQLLDFHQIVSPMLRSTCKHKNDYSNRLYLRLLYDEKMNFQVTFLTHIHHLIGIWLRFVLSPISLCKNLDHISN